MQLPRTFVLTVDRPIARYDATEKHLNELGISFERFNGFDNTICQLLPVQTFDLDRAGEKIGVKHVAACLSHYLLWKCMSMQPDDSFIVFEYDVVLHDPWEDMFDAATMHLPNDWDIVMLGSCCTQGRETTHIGGFIYEVKYPLCGHAIMYRKKALPVLLQECQRIYAPLDISLFYGAFTKLRVYTVLPSIVNQRGTPLHA